MSGFHVVVAQCTTKVAHFIEHACTKVGGSGVYVIIIVGSWLALQNISVVDEQHPPFTLFGAQAFHVG